MKRRKVDHRTFLPSWPPGADRLLPWAPSALSRAFLTPPSLQSVFEGGILGELWLTATPRIGLRESFYCSEIAGMHVYESIGSVWRRRERADACAEEMLAQPVAVCRLPLELAAQDWASGRRKRGVGRAARELHWNE